MIHIFSLKYHLDSNEKILLFFRPSRKAYILHYIGFGLLFIACAFFSFYGQPSSNLFILWKFINYASRIVWGFATFMLLRLEYRIWSRKYALTTDRLIYSRGIFSEKFKSTLYHKVTDISLTQSFWDKLLNTGTITINTAGTDKYEIRYRKISDPITVKKAINDRQG